MATSQGPYNVTVGVETPVDPLSGAIAIEIVNESNYAIQVKTGGGVEWLPAWTGDLFPLPSPASSAVSLNPQAISNAANPPSAVVLTCSYFPGDIITGTFPYSLNRQTNLGNGSIAANVNQVINDTNTAPFIVVEGRPSTAPASAQLEWNNDGSGIFGGGAGTVDNAGYISTKAYTATGTHNNGTGNYAFAGGAVYFDSGAFRTTGSGSLISTGNLSATSFIPANGNGSFVCYGLFSGTGSGTVATNAGQTPQWVGITDSQAGSSMTVGVVISGSNAVVTAGASHTWKGAAI